MHGIYSYYYNVLYSVCSIPLIVEDLMAVTIVEEFDAALNDCHNSEAVVKRSLHPRYNLLAHAGSLHSLSDYRCQPVHCHEQCLQQVLCYRRVAAQIP